jgi:hypothetical protein
MRYPRAVRSAAVVLLLVIATATRAYADDDLARARQLEASLEYEQALALVDVILARGGADPARFVELHVLAGRLAAGLERVEAAEDHFARALAVRPATALPEGTSPKLTAPFTAAKSRTTPLVVEVSSANGAVTLTARDPLKIVAGIAVAIDDHGTRRDVVESHALTLAIPDGAKPIEVAALDAKGNRVWIGPAPAEAKVIEPPPIVVPNHTSFIARPSTWAIATTLVLAGAGVAAWRFGVDQREWNRLRDAGNTDFTELQALETRGKRWGLAANIGFGVALATGVTTGILWLRRGPSSVVVTPGTSGVGIAGRF